MAIATGLATDPLTALLPVPEDRAPWLLTAAAPAADTGEVVYHFEHRGMGRALRLDGRCRVYGQDVEGVVRLFGRGGPLALSVALNAVYDGMEQHRPSAITLPTEEPGG